MGDGDRFNSMEVSYFIIIIFFALPPATRERVETADGVAASTENTAPTQRLQKKTADSNQECDGARRNASDGEFPENRC